MGGGELSLLCVEDCREECEGWKTQAAQRVDGVACMFPETLREHKETVPGDWTTALGW